MKIQSINTTNSFYNIQFQSFGISKIKTKPIIRSGADMFKKSASSNFRTLRDKFSEKLYKIYVATESACWDFYINSNNKNLNKYQKLQDKFSKLYQNKTLYNKFLAFKDNPDLTFHEAKQLKHLLKDFEEELKSGEDLKRLREKENEISQKYNSYVPKIDGKETSKTEIVQILEKEPNVELRKKALKAKDMGGDLIAEDLKEFVKMRNEYAKSKGYKNYYEYMLQESYEVNPQELEILLEDVYAKSKSTISDVLSKEQKDLAKFFNVNKEDLQAYHYGFLNPDNPEKKVNDSIKDKEQVVEICKQAYKNMGYNVDKFISEGKLVLDLFPRKGKNTHGFCFTIDTDDTRILANLTNNTNSIDTLNHELGHSVYLLGTSKNMPFLDRENYPAMTEAVAMMMGDLQKRENILKEIAPQDVLQEFKDTFVKDEARFITKALTIINFEREMYKNPEQDLKKLWHDMKVKYQNRSGNEELTNGWATIPHYLSHPAYYQNYFRATIIKAQLYTHLIEKMGQITENKKTAKYLKDHLFKYGVSMEENELIEKFTGKKLSVEDFVKSIS